MVATRSARWLIIGAVGLVALTVGTTVALMSLSPWEGNTEQAIELTVKPTTPAPPTITGAEAEAHGVSAIRNDPTGQQWIQEGYSPFCKASEDPRRGWIVQCGMKRLFCHLQNCYDDTKQQIVTYVVDGLTGEITQQY